MLKQLLFIAEEVCTGLCFLLTLLVANKDRHSFMQVNAKKLIQHAGHEQFSVYQNIFLKEIISLLMSIIITDSNCFSINMNQYINQWS